MIGRVVTFRGRETRIVGVVQNVRLHGPEAALRTEIYMPVFQEVQLSGGAYGQLVVRSIAPARATASGVLEAIRPALEASRTIEPRFVDDDFRRLTADRRFNASLMTIFGALAVAIGASGIYGTVTFVVAQQARAIGLCLALGASRRSVLRSTLMASLWRVGVGVVLGVIGARAAAGLLTSLVFGVEATSPLVYAAVAIGLATTGVLSALGPAYRATRLDPVAALRAE